MMGSMIVGSAMMGLLKRTRFLRLIFIGFVSQSEKVRDGVGDRTLVDVELQGECILCDDAADELRQRLLMSSSSIFTSAKARARWSRACFSSLTRCVECCMLRNCISSAHAA
jgi:hypothetical protein